MNLEIATIRRPATYQDVLAAPPGMVAELIRGALHLQPRPRPKHSWAILRLGVKLIDELITFNQHPKASSFPHYSA